MIHRVVRLNAPALPNRAARSLTGTAATTFQRFAQDHRDVWHALPTPDAEQNTGR